ncbi:MAG TPA: hypothetical protein VEY91_09255 [Candidatus Limnocylindria bacterium]|nr:hypothetical protein [Candidatus Limnocylindria bacterium]
MRTLSPRWHAFPSVLVAVAIAASGCGKNASPTMPAPPDTPLSQQAADDLARHFGASLARTGGVPLSQVGSTDLPAIARGQAPHLVRSNLETLADEGEFSWSFSLTYYDANGNEQPGYHPLTTARVRVVARARGRLTTAEHQAFVGVYRLLDVQGLLPSETTIEIDGAANDTADCQFAASDGSAERRYHLLANGTLVDVRQLKDSSVNPYPLSGTARWNVVVNAFVQDQHGTVETHHEVTVVVTFNGTKHPDIDIDGTHHYQGDLDTGHVQRVPA